MLVKQGLFHRCQGRRKEADLIQVVPIDVPQMGTFAVILVRQLDESLDVPGATLIVILEYYVKDIAAAKLFKGLHDEATEKGGGSVKDRMIGYRIVLVAQL